MPANTVPAQWTSGSRTAARSFSSSPIRWGRRRVGSGLGLIGMRERVAAVGGSFEAGFTGDTFTVRVTLPTGTVSIPMRSWHDDQDPPRR